MPAVSVVVATQSRAERLARLLGALREQREVDHEVVVVADGATREVRELLDAAEGVRVEVHGTARGPAAARNTGWRAARADVVAFTDDDCRPAPGWLRALTAADGDVVQGRVEPEPGELHRLDAFARTLRVEGAGPFFQTANIRYPRALLARLGGFDERFPLPAGEDTDLGWRAREDGARIGFAADALVYHAVHAMGPLALARDAKRWGTTVRVVARHPGIRAHVHRRVFYKRSHERLLAVALASRLGPVPALAAAAWWAAGHRGEHPSAAALARSLPGHALVDAAEFAAMVRGSVEHRTLLL